MSKKIPNELTISDNSIETIGSIANLSKLHSLCIGAEKKQGERQYDHLPRIVFLLPLVYNQVTKIKVRLCLD
jgi:hypothetical protein